jgi:ubiquinone/menaquinone biosynthesis C-methylase UbiE
MRKRLFAALYSRIEGRMVLSTERYRRRLVEGLTGRVLEIGCGPGGGFEYYDPAATVTATDYSEHMLKRAHAAAAAAPASVTVKHADVMNLQFEDDSFDAAVSALVLCSVPDPARALAELRRVVRPGGELRLFEHVRSDRRWVSVVQRVVTPLWRIPADGCRLDRDTERAVHDAGFEVTSSERRSLGLPHILLSARPPGEPAGER